MELHQQYHFRKSDKGLLAWDVLRLIKLSKDFAVIQVPLSEIRELKETYWFGLGAPPVSEDIATCETNIRGRYFLPNHPMSLR